MSDLSSESPHPTVVDYEGTDLEVMAETGRYASWIAHDLNLFLGKRILEVGAGLGSMSRHLLKTEPELLIALEPSAQMFARLRSLPELSASSTTEIQLVNAVLQDSSDRIKEACIDSAVYINVLEHIEEDTAELKLVFDLLEPGGVVGIYVPALPSLYGPFDRAVGHFRRYTRDSLVEVVSRAGFEMVLAEYRDLAGLIPWWISAKILRTSRLFPGAARLYDRLVPLVRALDRITGAPIGKNVLLIGRKPA